MIEGDEKDKIKKEIEVILDKEFSEAARKRVFEYPDRLNFSCPYCGDSFKDPMKKRGNLYLDSGFYHCYNDGCEVHPHALKLLRDFGRSVDDPSFTFRVMNSVDKEKGKRGFTGKVQQYVGAFAALDSFAIPAEDFLKKHGLMRIGDSPKLKSRFDPQCLYIDDVRQAFSPKNDALFYLNVNAEGNVVGYQQKPLGPNARIRFYTAGLKMLLGDMDKEVTTDGEYDLERLDYLSNIFNVLLVDFSSPFYITEGPSDALLLRNSIAKQGVGKGVNLGKERGMYLFDYEKEALEQMRGMAKDGYSVFEWSKYLDDHKVSKKKDLDLRDIFKIALEREDAEMINEPIIRSYFTETSMDVLYV